MRWLWALGLLATVLCAGCRAGRETFVYEANPERAGFSRDAWTQIALPIEDAVRQGQMPGAVISVGRDGRIVFERAFGTRDPMAKGRPPMTRDTLFDVASLTKPVATAAAVGALVCEGLLAADGGIPGEELSLDALLTHSAGLPEYIDPRRLASVPGGPGRPGSTALALARAENVLSPGGQYRYGNLGYLLLSQFVEDQTGEALGDFAADEVWRPLGMTRTTFHPAAVEERLARSAGDVPLGRPFDPLAHWVLLNAPGRDPGHSGLFSTATDLTRFAQSVLAPAGQRWQCLSAFLLGGGREIPHWPGPEGVALAGAARRTRAFALADDGSLSHTGYTGAVLYLDPETGLSIVLLTNASYGNAAEFEDLWAAVLRTTRRSLKEDRSP
ncbi:MAG: serine hydrolase domain-containing protein [Sumerlaeia bacterium]